MENLNTQNFLRRKKRGDLQAVEQHLAAAGTPVMRWKISDMLNGKRLDEPEAKLVLDALAEVIAARELLAQANVAEAQVKYEALIQSAL